MVAEEIYLRIEGKRNFELVGIFFSISLQPINKGILSKSKMNVTLKKIKSLAVVLITTIPFFSAVFADEVVPIQWAGISVIGSYSDAQIVAPITSKMIENKEFKLMLNTRLIEELKKYNKSSKNFKVVFDDYLSGKDIDSLALSFAIAGEDETLTEIDGVLSATVRLQILALVINMSPDENARKIVTSIPLRVRHRFVLKDLNDFPFVKTNTLSAMLDGSGKGKILDAVALWGEKLAKIKFRDRDLFLAVKPLTFSDDAIKIGNFSREEVKNMAYRASSMLQSIISEKSDIPILPNNLDSTLSTLVVSFANTDQSGFVSEMGFKIPERIIHFKFQIRN